MNISEILKQKRSEFNLTQDQLAEKILVSKKTISNWETGKTVPDIESLLRLSDTFGLSLDELIRGDQKVVEKIKQDTNTVESNKKVILILLIIGGVYLVLFLINQMIAIPKITEPFVNSLFIIFIMGCLLWYVMKIKNRFITKRRIINLSWFSVVVVIMCLIAYFLNQHIYDEWQQNILRVAVTFVIAIVGYQIFKEQKE